MKGYRFVFAISLILMVSLSSGKAVGSLSSSVTDLDGDSTFVMGRPVETTFNYTVSQNIQVAFAVDETYSMGPVISGVKDNIKWFYNQIGGNTEGTIVGSGCDDEYCADPDYPGDQSGSSEPRDTASGDGLTSNLNDLEMGVDRLAERTTSEGPDDTISEAVGYGTEASDYTNGIEYYEDESYAYDSSTENAVIWVQDGGARGTCSEVSDFSEGALGDYMKDNGFRFYAIVRDLSGCKSNYESAASQTGGKVYRLSSNPSNEDWQDILGDISSTVQADINLTAVTPSQTINRENYDSKYSLNGYSAYKFNNVDSSEGKHSFKFKWWPTDYGTMAVKTGDSFLDVKGPSGQNKYGFSGSKQADVKYVDLNISETNISRIGDRIYIDLVLRNKGNIASKERYLEISDEEGNYINRTISSISAGGSYKESFSVGGNHEVFQNSDRISAHFDFQGIFDGLSVGEGQILEPDEENNKKLMGYPPRLQSISPDSVQWNDTFRFSLDFGHYFSDMVQGNYSVYEDGTLIRDNVSYNKPAEGTLRTGYIDNDKSRIWYNITSYIKGPAGAISVYNHSYYVRNPRPEIYASEPKNLNPVYDEPVRLRAYVDDKNNIENLNDLDVKIYNQETGNLLKEETGVPPRSSVTYEWPDADKAGKVYRWNVTVSDRWHTISEVFRFRKSTRNSYRAETQSDYSYSAVVTSAGSPGNFEYTVNNPLDFDKNNMETSLSGVNASFADGSDTKSYSLPSKSSKTFDIVVSPDQSSTGQQYLTVTTENLNLGINNTDRIPVYVREDAKRSYGVPGLGLGQLLIIMLSSAALFYRKV